MEDMATDIRNASKNSKVDLRLTTGLLIFIVMQTLGAVWWAASITSDQKHLLQMIEETIANSFTAQEGKNLQLQIDSNQEDIIEIKALLLRIDTKIDQINR